MADTLSRQVWVISYSTPVTTWSWPRTRTSTTALAQKLGTVTDFLTAVREISESYR